MCALNEWHEAGWRAYDAAWIYSLYVRNLPEPASVWADRCAEAWMRGGGKLEQAAGLHIRSLVARQREDCEATERLLQDVPAIYRDLLSDAHVAIVLADLGDLERDRRAYDIADRYYSEALALNKKSASKVGITDQYNNLGLIALDRKRWGEARGWYEKALALAHERGHQDKFARALDGLARVHEAQGYPDLALPLAHEALAIRERLRNRDLAQTRELVERLTRNVGGQ